MREILFRGKREDNGEWVYGSLHIEYGETDRNGNQTLNYRILGMRGECDYVEPETVGQDTGLTDKNGTKIFEGDIVNCISSDYIGHTKTDQIIVKDMTDYNTMVYLNCSNELEIIGKIHDNPELIGG